MHTYIQALEPIGTSSGRVEKHMQRELSGMRGIFGSLVIPVKPISMMNQVNKEYPLMLVILLLSG